MPQKPTTRRGRPKRSAEDTEQMRAAIKQAARNLFASEGYEGVSMRKLATRAGCAPAAIYAYFSNKRAVLHLVWEEIFADLTAIMAEEATVHADPLERLEALGQTMIRFWLGRPDDFRAIFLIEDRPQSADDVYFARTSPSLSGIGHIQTAAEEAVAAGSVRPADAQRITRMIVTAVTGTALNLITIPEYDWGDTQTLATDMVSTLIRGLMQGPTEDMRTA